MLNILFLTVPLNLFDILLLINSCVFHCTLFIPNLTCVSLHYVVDLNPYPFHSSIHCLGWTNHFYSHVNSDWEAVVTNLLGKTWGHAFATQSSSNRDDLVTDGLGSVFVIFSSVILKLLLSRPIPFSHSKKYNNLFITSLYHILNPN